jgi:hypothetical protein
MWHTGDGRMTFKFTRENLDSIYRHVTASDPSPKTGPSGYIQWKGTDACLDLHCKCGQHDHIDADFTYYWECSACKTVYALSSFIRVVEMSPEQAAFLRKDVPGCIKTSLPPHELEIR